MKILERYVFKEFLKYFILLTIAFYFIFVLGNFIEKMDHIKNFNFNKIAQYYLYSFPDIFNMLLPYILFFSILLSFLNLGKNNETIIMQVSGIRPLVFLKSIFIFIFFLAIFTFFNYSYIAPKYKFKAYRIYRIDLMGDLRYFREMGKRDLGLVFKQGNKYYLYSEYYNSRKEMLLKPVIVILDKNLKLLKFITAKEALYLGRGTWKFEIYKEKVFNNGKIVLIKRKREKTLPLHLDPHLFNTKKLDPENFTLSELHRKIKILKHIGKATTKFSLEFNLRFAFAIFILLIPFFAFPMALQFRRGNSSKIIGLSLIIITFYIMVFRFALTLGNNGILSPFIGAWIIDLIVAVALIIFGKKRKIVL